MIGVFVGLILGQQRDGSRDQEGQKKRKPRSGHLMHHCRLSDVPAFHIYSGSFFGLRLELESSKGRAFGSAGALSEILRRRQKSGPKGSTPVHSGNVISGSVINFITTGQREKYNTRIEGT